MRPHVYLISHIEHVECSVNWPCSDFHQIWAVEVFQHALPIFKMLKCKKKKKYDVITSVLYRPYGFCFKS